MKRYDNPAMSEVPRDDFSRPVVFLGPSLELEHARRILPASYRLPIKRGDLVDVPPGALVGIIDGVFQHSASVSPREIHRAVERGVRIFGASSMGALRALEVSGMIGVGRVYEMYRDGLIVSDDEVALALDPDTQKPLTVPLVNVRFAIDRLVRSGTLDRALGDRIVEAAIRLHFAERTYPAIMAEAGLGTHSDVRDLIAMLAQIDLKREDAHTLLETLASVVEQGWAPPAAGAAVEERPDYGAPDRFHEIHAAATLPADAPVSIWETGDRVAFLDLVFFLRMTGKLDEHARNALARFVMDGNELDPAEAEDDAQAMFSYMCTCWGWMTGEEAHVTTRDLGLGMDDLGERCGEELAARAAVRAIVSEGSEEFLRALRAELFLNDLALKRETMRLGSLERLAAQGREAGPLGAEEIAEARGRLAALNRLDWARLQATWAYHGVEPEAAAAFVDTLAYARRVAHAFHEQLAVRRSGPAVSPLEGIMGLASSPKASGDPRYCIPMQDALEATRRLRDVIGVTRVGMVGELGARGIHISQAARPSGMWSSTYGSGKGETQEGAMVGGVMEEVEKWAQERFEPANAELIVASYRSLGERAVDPASLDLPHDSRYHPDLKIEWYPCWDLLQRRQVLVPLAILASQRRLNDIYYSPRGCRRLLGTNGLASGFTLPEALVHAICEVIERHALRLDELDTNNPGRSLADSGRHLDPDSYPAALARLVASVEEGGVRKLLIKDITCGIRVPVLHARLFVESDGDWVDSSGWGAHPNPEVAARMAVLEAAQSWISVIAGGREDLTLKARSLGRHERPRPYRAPPFAVFEDPDKLLIDTEQVGGVISNDAYDEVLWLLQRLHEAGVDHVLAVDLSVPEIAPARACRVVIPGLDTTNPYHISDRGRMALLHDLLPRLPRRQ